MLACLLVYKMVFKVMRAFSELNPASRTRKKELFMSNIDRRTLLKLAGLIGVTAAMPFSFARASDQPLVVGFIYVGARDDFGYNWPNRANYI